VIESKKISGPVNAIAETPVCALSHTVPNMEEALFLDFCDWTETETHHLEEPLKMIAGKSRQP
jgi:hypothetical protein